MRPPHYAGENEGPVWIGVDVARRFNEAPALRGGKLLVHVANQPDEIASMRPPHYAGENSILVFSKNRHDKPLQ